jgi:hypothetical protein
MTFPVSILLLHGSARVPWHVLPRSIAVENTLSEIGWKPDAAPAAASPALAFAKQAHTSYDLPFTAPQPQYSTVQLDMRDYDETSPGNNLCAPAMSATRFLFIFSDKSLLG